jgi:gamma-glutamylcyclotransferase (GGCT)/AIG2-like uncharacterized protein YtfP
MSFIRDTETKGDGSAEYVAFYGSLMRGHGAQEHLSIGEKLAYVGPCLIGGALYDLGCYPGVCTESTDGRVVGELFRIVDPGALAVLDEYEDFRPHEPEQSLFERRLVRLVEPGVDAWVYFYRHSPPVSARIPHGDWARHRTTQT